MAAVTIRDSDEESRTAILGTPRARDGQLNGRNKEESGMMQNNSRKRRRRNREGKREVHDFVPNGGRFPAAVSVDDSSEERAAGSEEGEISSAVDAEITPSASKNGASAKGATVEERFSDGSPSADVMDGSRVIDLTSSDEISDSDEAQQTSSNLILNIPGAFSQDPLEISDEEAPPSFLIDTEGAKNEANLAATKAIPARKSNPILGAEPQLLQSPTHTDPGTAPDEMLNEKPMVLADLDDDELENQFRYAIFYMDRQKIDFNYPAGVGRKQSASIAKSGPLGLRIKGRAPLPEAGVDLVDDDTHFFGPRVPSKQQSHIRFNEDIYRDRSRRTDNRPPGYSSNQHGPARGYATHEYRDDRRSDFAAFPDPNDRYSNPFADDRRRSRSPHRSGRGGDSWQPPLPPGPPPGPPKGRPPRGLRSQNGRGGGSRFKNMGGDVYRPMPSAGKKNWDRGRL
ncbi:MAG: hypothetical protein Q9227_003364 [Pyrenula ochraceoflavens]